MKLFLSIFLLLFAWLSVFADSAVSGSGNLVLTSQNRSFDTTLSIGKGLQFY